MWSAKVTFDNDNSSVATATATWTESDGDTFTFSHRGDRSTENVTAGINRAIAERDAWQAKKKIDADAAVTLLAHINLIDPQGVK